MQFSMTFYDENPEKAPDHRADSSETGSSLPRSPRVMISKREYSASHVRLGPHSRGWSEEDRRRARARLLQRDVGQHVDPGSRKPASGRRPRGIGPEKRSAPGQKTGPVDKKTSLERRSPTAMYTDVGKPSISVSADREQRRGQGALWTFPAANEFVIWPVGEYTPSRGW